MERQADNSSSDRRTEILLEAARVFRTHGYGGTSMNHVAKRLNITKPGLYYHFKSKQDLLYAILDYALDLLERDALAATMGAKGSIERLRNIIYRHARMITMESDGALTVLVVDEADSLTPEDWRMITQRKRTYFEIVRATIEQLRVEGKLRDGVDPTLAAFSLFGMVMWLTRWYRPEGRLSADDVARQITDLALAAILKEPVDPTPPSE
jgi:AcrR family transcriptional regulator